MEVVINDTIQAVTSEKVVVNLAEEKYVARIVGDPEQVSLSDSYQLVPYAKRLTMDYTLPESLTTGIIQDVDDLRVDLLDEIADREIAIIGAENYAKTYSDGIVSQLYTDVAANYLSSVNADAYILKSALASYQITYDTGSGNTTASFQDLNDTVVAVENAQAGYTTDLNVIVDATSALASRTTSLEASVNDVIVSIDSLDEVEVTPEGWQIASSKFAVDPNGNIVGWKFTDGSQESSTFTIAADHFMVANGTNSHVPFTIDTLTGVSKFHGRVEFSSLDSVPPLVSDNTNINTITNIVPTLTWQANDHADYDFVGAPVYTSEIGAGDFHEPTLELEVGDEVYSPYIDELALYDYKVSYAFKGAEIGTIYMADDTVFTSHDIIPTGLTLDSAKWYLVQVLVNRNGITGSSTFGVIKDAITFETISTIPALEMEVDKTRFFVGFVGTATTTKISRVSIEVMSADISNIDNVDTEFLKNATALYLVQDDFGPAGTTEIDGGRIVAGTSIAAPIINGGEINGNVINGGEINGTVIRGVNIEGSVIKSSWIDYSSSGSLTNWKYYGPGLLPPDDTNFARDNETNALVISDIGSGPSNLGYYRLPCLVPIQIPAVTGGTSGGNGTRVISIVRGFLQYDSYTDASLERFITEDGIYKFNTQSIIFQGYTDNQETSYSPTTRTNYLSISVNGVSQTFTCTFNSNLTTSTIEMATVNGMTLEITKSVIAYPSSDTTINYYDSNNYFSVKVTGGSTIVPYGDSFDIVFSLWNAQFGNYYNYITYTGLPVIQGN